MVIETTASITIRVSAAMKGRWCTSSVSPDAEVKASSFSASFSLSAVFSANLVQSRLIGLCSCCLLVYQNSQTIAYPVEVPLLVMNGVGSFLLIIFVGGKAGELLLWVYVYIKERKDYESQYHENRFGSVILVPNCMWKSR